MTTITANIQSRKVGKNTYAAFSRVFNQDADGRWSCDDLGAMTEADVIDMCQRASNWAAIKSAHFPMVGFHN